MVRKATNKKPKSIGKIFFKFFSVTFIVCLILFTSGLGIYAAVMNARPFDSSDGGGQPAGQTEEKIDILIPGEGIFATEFQNSKRVNILLLGNTDEGLSDTIMLASFDPENQRVDVISLPRDTYYDRDGKHGAELKLNAVNHDGAAAVALAAHNILMGIPINYTATVSYDGVVNIVDAIGGVTFDVPVRMYYSSPSQNLLIDLKPGEQILDGAHAVQLLRFRSGYSNGDLGRVEMQQAFVKEAAKQAMAIDKLPALARTALDNVESDITIRAMLYLVSKAKGMDGDSIATYMLPGASGRVGSSSLSFYLRAEDPEIETMLRSFYAPPPETTESAIEEGEETAAE